MKNKGRNEEQKEKNMKVLEEEQEEEEEERKRKKTKNQRYSRENGFVHPLFLIPPPSPFPILVDARSLSPTVAREYPHPLR